MANIHSIELTNFRNIKKAKIDLGSFNVIVGPNNSGKSNFLQIFNFLNFVISEDINLVEKCFSGKASDSRFVFRPYLDKKSTGNSSINLKYYSDDEETIFNYYISINYKESETPFDYRYAITSEYLDYKKCSSPGKAAIIFKRDENRIIFGEAFKKTSIIETISNHASVLRILNLIINKNEDSVYDRALDYLQNLINTPVFYFSNTELSKDNLSSRINSFGGRVISTDLDNEIVELLNSPNAQAYKNALSSILSIQDIDFFRLNNPNKDDSKSLKGNDSFVTYVKHFNILKNVRDLSDGSILLIALITKLFSSKNSLFLIEEPENSIHPKALMDLVSLLRSFQSDKQFLITSHSIPLVNLCKIEELIFISINGDGWSEISKLSNAKELKQKLKSGYVSFSDEVFFGDLDEYFNADMNEISQKS